MKSASIYFLIVLLSLGVISSAPAPANHKNEAEANSPRFRNTTSEDPVVFSAEKKSEKNKILSVDSAPDLVEAHVVHYEAISSESTTLQNGMSRKVGSIKQKCSEIEALLRERIKTDDRQQYTSTSR
tara:strand:- start:2185 stop:2565 length:381 start_codon:yes stop_codon:yes gene_type:complete